MTTMTDLVDRYIDTWNETDGVLRRELVGRTFTESGAYLDPMAAGQGLGGIDAMIAGVQARFPGYTFSRIGEVDAHNDRLRFGWSLQSPEAVAVARGTDFGVVAGDGRLQSVTGFLDYVAT